MKKKLLLGLLVISVVTVGTWSSLYQGKIYAGVSTAGVKTGGLSESTAKAKLREALSPSEEIKLIWGSREWTIAPQSIGLEYKIDDTVRKLMAVGRDKDIITNVKNIYFANREGRIIDPSFTLNDNQLNQATALIAADVNIPAQEPEINFDKTSNVIVVTPGENGQEVDARLLTQRILQSIKSLSKAPIEVPVVQLQPKLNETQLNLAQIRAQKLVGKKLIIKSQEDNTQWILEDTQMLAWIDPQGTGWKQQGIENWVNELAQNVNRPAENANFRVVGAGKVEEFKPGREGLRIKQDEVKQAITLALSQTEAGQTDTIVNLATEVTQPEIKTGDANNLGIKELIGRGESWFSGSIDNRIFNIQKATLVLNGVLIAPGETFSFNQKVGEISQATGYKPAYIIKEGKTVLGDGGGVCQVSSTLFRAVLHSGLPIPERLAHAYRVYYYEEKSEPGFDATVFQPSPDFKFVNDTPAYILIQTNFDAVNKHVVFDIYGTNDGRQVTVSKARIWEVIPPPPDLYQDDATKPVGYLVQMEHSAWGAKVAFDWKVTRGNEVLQDRTFYSNYAPWQAVFVRGTKQ